MQFTPQPNNLTLGRGRVFFAKFAPGTRTPTAERYFGNTPDLKLAITPETLEHFSSEGGVKEVDDAVTLKTTRKATLKTDNMTDENLALWFLGSSDVLNVAAATVSDEVIAGSRVTVDGIVQLGVTASDPSGANNVNSVVVTNTAGTTTYVEGTDYEVDEAAGFIHILVGGDIADGQALKVDYDVPAHKRTRSISGKESIEGQLRFVSDNPAGENKVYVMPYVRLSPAGDLMLKGDTWQEVEFQAEIIKSGGLAAVILNGQTFV